ncbi:MAG: hypothetical protein FJW88_09400 [Actinobacteria bacterium]|nr:hypothetical protein [Actinomycetota bacterium]
MIWPAALTTMIVLAVVVIVAVAREPGPRAVDVALGFEHAWDRLDFDAVYRMCGSELRDGLTRGDYVTTKRAAYAPRAAAGVGRRVADATAEEVLQARDTAVVCTRLVLKDGCVVRNEIRLVRRSGEWLVVAYALRPAAA